MRSSGLLPALVVSALLVCMWFAGPLVQKYFEHDFWLPDLTDLLTFRNLVIVCGLSLAFLSFR